ncbi:MAG: acetyl-CoA C-acyltransferase [Bacteroidetes bacterium]|nr:acetyl-CoA C-acyltransferase [Bacteroidota bacterium]
MNAAYIIDAVRTPIGKFGGALGQVRPDDLAALVIKELLKRQPNYDPAITEEVILGAANQAGEDNRNVARMAALLAGLPVQVAGVTVNRLCGSGLQSIMDAARAIAAGHGDAYIVGGTESMTRAPFVMAKNEQAWGRNVQVYDTTIGWRFTNPALAGIHHPYSMGETAENVAERWAISREDQDLFAHGSQAKYQVAHQQGRFLDELVPVAIPRRKGGDLVVEFDEHPRLSSVEELAKLAPAFKKGGTVTAGNSSGINDGASVLLMVSEKLLVSMGLKPMARVVSAAAAGVDPAIMGVGPVPAVNKALARAGLSMADLDLVELNEAFAAQSLACMRDLDLDPNKVNVNGGAIALGHPLGASGARISTTLLHEMNKRSNCRMGVATMCVGVGQGVAVIFEKL